MVKLEAGGGGDAAAPGGRARAGGAIKEAGTAKGGGGLVEVQEGQGGDCSRSGSLSVWVGSHLEGIEAIQNGG